MHCKLNFLVWLVCHLVFAHASADTVITAKAMGGNSPVPVVVGADGSITPALDSAFKHYGKKNWQEQSRGLELTTTIARNISLYPLLTLKESRKNFPHWTLRSPAGQADYIAWLAKSVPSGDRWTSNVDFTGFEVSAFFALYHISVGRMISLTVFFASRYAHVFGDRVSAAVSLMKSLQEHTSRNFVSWFMYDGECVMAWSSHCTPPKCRKPATKAPILKAFRQIVHSELNDEATSVCIHLKYGEKWSNDVRVAKKGVLNSL
ncbi:uncharacterized protein LALA0_S14e00672g [Lachancea lanzarotensis]|uniref:LALA0S14e00672g1_1 n=1 Tax=Lachancea lanzarotensis TaxID=1245769 RepID=A0A0C7NGK2_9SACH|nr:uncharacterized protein LALA0_S14e00672g [Lachancea lanzarotensis]CEP64849.1 LALA0S14e00672g1_1 [Lachancea lanzarotensis]